MERLLAVIGNGAGVVGVLICLVAGATRLAGSFYAFGYEAGTLFLGGTALMVMACLAKLHQLTSGRD